MSDFGTLEGVPGARQLGLSGRFAKVWISSKLTPLLISGALLLGGFAVRKWPREEEP